MSTSVMEPQPKQELEREPPVRPSTIPANMKPETDVWTDAYRSDVFKLALKKRAGFFIPALGFATLLFLGLWVIQASFPAIARYRLYGFINVNFVYTMAIFPLIWTVGILFVRYVRREVYPLEDELHRRFGKRSAHE